MILVLAAVARNIKTVTDKKVIKLFIIKVQHTHLNINNIQKPQTVKKLIEAFVLFRQKHYFCHITSKQAMF